MHVSRRNFICSVAGAGAVALGLDIQRVVAQARTLKTSKTIETRSNCPYCAVYCGVITHTMTDGSSAINIWAFGEGYQAIGRHSFNL